MPEGEWLACTDPTPMHQLGRLGVAQPLIPEQVEDLPLLLRQAADLLVGLPVQDEAGRCQSMLRLRGLAWDSTAVPASLALLIRQVLAVPGGFLLGAFGLAGPDFTAVPDLDVDPRPGCQPLVDRLRLVEALLLHADGAP